MPRFIKIFVILLTLSSLVIACEQPQLEKQAKKSVVKDKPVITKTAAKTKLSNLGLKTKVDKTDKIGKKPKLMLARDLKKLERAEKVMIDLDIPIPEGRFPLLPVWSSLTPRKRGCSVTVKQEVVRLNEIEHKSTKFTKIKTDKCTGYIKSKFIVELP